MASRKKTWHDDVFVGLHFDLHATATDTELGKELTHEHLRDCFRKIRPDWVQCDCKGHPGYTSWPTKVGSTSPGLIKDMLRIYRDVTKELGIKLAVHYSGVWDTRAIELNPQWGRVKEDGSRDPDFTCRLSGYTENLMIPQLIEIIDNYDVDGFWVDGENWAVKLCWCDLCKQEFIKRTGLTEIPYKEDQANWESWKAFHRDLFVEHVNRYANAVHKRKPDCTVCSNWMYTIRQPDNINADIDYLSGDYDWIWGANRAAIEGRFLDSRDCSWDLMAWTFTKSGPMNVAPQWTMKTTLHICQEVSEVLALGGAISLYAVPQRTGWLSNWHCQMLSEVVDFCRERKKYCFKTKTYPQVAILHSADHFYFKAPPVFLYGDAVEPVEGALHALLENHYSADILNEDTLIDNMDKYKLVVVPEQTRLSAKLLNKLQRYASNGGFVFMTGHHLADECADLAGVEKVETKIVVAKDVAPVYLEVNGRTVGVSNPWQFVRPTKDSAPLVYRYKHQDTQKDKTNDIVGVRRNMGRGAIISVFGPIFSDYFKGHYPILRHFIKNIIDSLGIDWKVRVIKAPAWMEMILRDRDGKLLINLIHRGSGEMTYGNRTIVEELPPIEDIVLEVKTEKKFKSAQSFPTGMNMDIEYTQGSAIIRIDKLHVFGGVLLG